MLNIKTESAYQLRIKSEQFLLLLSNKVRLSEEEHSERNVQVIYNASYVAGSITYWGVATWVSDA